MIGLYAKVYSPSVQGENPLFDIRLENLSFETNAVGGFWSAGTTITLNLQSAEDWYEDGLGRVINIFDETGFLAWRGFVNQVTLNAGDTSEIRGPLMNVMNRIYATYTPRDFDVYPPADGSQTQTIAAENTISQNKYGVMDGTISAGACPEETAEKVRDVELAKSSLPKTTGSFSLSPGSTQNPTVTLALLGNVHWLQRYIYDNTSTSQSYLSDKIIDILTYDPNSVLSTFYGKIEQNVYLVNDIEDKQRYAWAILSELLTIGDDTTDTRCIFGAYENDVAIYGTIPSTIAYQYNLGKAQIISNYQSGTIIRPWAIRPGRWITVPDFLIGRNIPSTNLYNDPRNKFIESVRYSSPYTIDLSGGETDRLSQMLAKITYTGGIY